MKKGIIGVLIGAVIIVGGGLSVWSNAKTAINLQERIESKYLSNQSNYDSMWKSMVESAQITELQASQFKDIYTDLIANRNKDTNLLFKSIHEQNPQIDTSVYTRLQENITDNRKVFDNNQKALLDMIREYNSYIRIHPITAWIFHYDQLDKKDYITTSSDTMDAFQTKQADSIDIIHKDK